LDDPGFALATISRRRYGDALCVVDPEEIRIENSLDNARNDGNGVPEARHLEKVPVDPIGNVQGTVCAKGEQVVGRDGFRLACSLQHEKLREDSNGFQPDGESPEDLCHGQLQRTPL
jgi:hypothetical protein